MSQIKYNDILNRNCSDNAPRINFKKVSDNDFVFDALMPTITRFKAHGIFYGQKVCVFESSNYGDIYCGKNTLERVIQRYKIHNLDTSILEQARF